MASKRLDQYRGKLSNEQLAHGINIARRNAKRLADDAEVLLGVGRYPSAVALAILSIEEAGKISILRSIALARDAQDLKRGWRDYRSHRKKNVLWMLPQFFAEGSRRLDDFASLFDKDAEHPALLDQVKQISLYTDCLADGHWSLPGEVIDQELAEMLVSISGLLANEKDTTVIEIQLWREHIGPIWELSKREMEAALEDWYDAMQELGLEPEGQNKMTQFVRHGIDTQGDS